MKEEEKRAFSMFTGDMLTLGQRFLNQYLENPTDFTAKYNVFKTPFETKMQDAIDLCKAADSDEFCVSKQMEATEIVEGLMGTGRHEYQGGKLYVELAWPNGAIKLKLYGQHLYEESRSSHTKLPALLMQGYNMASLAANKALLIAEGMTLLEIEALKTTSKAIDDAVQVQNSFKGARFLTTQERTANLNAVWAMMVQLSECAKKIYENNPVMWNLYLLYSDAPPAPPIPTPPTEPTV